MSEIGLGGVVAMFVALATIALGLAGLVAAGLVAVVTRLPPDDDRSARMGRLVAGPLACTALGVVLAIACAVAHGHGEMLYEVSLGCPVAGVGLWITVAVVLHRRRAATRRVMEELRAGLSPRQ